MKQLILHSIKMHKVQSLSITVSVALSVMILVTFGLVYGGVQEGIQKSERQSGADIMAIPINATRYVEDTELLYTGAPAPVYMGKEIVDELASIEGVEAASPQFYGQTLNLGCCSSGGDIRIIGIDVGTDFVVSGLSSDDAVDQLTGDHKAIVGSRISGVSDGYVRIYGEEYEVVGTLEETGTGFDQSIILDIDLLRTLSVDLEGYEHFWEDNGDPEDLVSCVMIKITDDDDGTVFNKVRGRINLSGVASPIAQAETVEKSSAQLESVFFLLLIAAILMAIVTLLQLYARFYSSVWDRKSELALYRAVGASKSDLRKLIIGEVGSLVGVGIVVGAVLGFIAQSGLLGIMQSGLAFPYSPLDPLPTVALVAGVVLVFAIVSLISIFVPLRQIGHLDPSSAMQQGDID